MNKLKGLFVVKLVAILLFIILSTLSIISVVGVASFMHFNIYGDEGKAAKADIFETITNQNADNVIHIYYNYKENPDGATYNQLMEEVNKEVTNFFFLVKDSDGQVLFSNYWEDEYQFRRYHAYSKYSYSGIDKDIIIESYVRSKLVANDKYASASKWIEFAVSFRYTIIGIMALTFILSLILFIFIIKSAGHEKNKEGIQRNLIDKIPFDLFVVIMIILFYISIVLINEINFWYPLDNYIGSYVRVAIGGIISILLILITCMSFATRYKIGNIHKNMLIYRAIRRIAYLISILPLVWKTGTFVLSYTIIEFVILNIVRYNFDAQMTIWLLSKIIFIPGIILLAYLLRLLLKGGEIIAKGNLDYQINNKYLFWDLKKHAGHLNSINLGISNAVEEKMKSERLKTELITNVSHDIKTPLTSIINYVDLLKKEENLSDECKEYIEILDRQSSKLKKLVEDVVEASKVSTGNINVEMQKTDVNVLITQIIGEFEERFLSKQLEMINSYTKESLLVMADSRLIWRVFDNLMNNIFNYAQESTRVYINVETDCKKVMITLRNISKKSLNISSDELLERFVRGDTSRNTEGSGLGLSIAKSLTEIQNGEFHLHIDGDLFKVILILNLVE